MKNLNKDLLFKKDLQDKYNQLKYAFININYILNYENIVNDKQQEKLFQNKIKFFKNAEYIIWEFELKWLIEYVTKSKINWENDYLEQSFNNILKIFDRINLEIAKTNNINIYASYSENHWILESKKIDNNSKNTSKKIKEEITKNNFDWENLRLLLKAEHNINNDNFEEILDNIKKYDKRTLKDIYKKILIIKKQMKIEDNELKDTLEDLLIVLQENIEISEETKEREEENLRKIEEESQLQKEKTTLKQLFSQEFSNINELIINMEEINNNIKNNWELNVSNSREEFISELTTIFERIKIWIKKCYSLSWVAKDIDYMLVIYNKQINEQNNKINNTQYLNAINKWYLLWDIYELILSIEEKYDINFDKSNFQKLENKIQEYNLKSELK